MVAFGAAMGGALTGYQIGVISQVLSMESFGETFNYYERVNGEYIKIEDALAEVTGWITFMFLLGAILGAAIVSYMADKLGRKRSITIGSIIFNVGVIGQCISSTTGLFYATRFISGVGVGILSSVVPLFIGEVSPRNIRGKMVSIQQLMLTIGILVASIVNSIIILSTDISSNLRWRLALGMQLVFGGFLLGIMFIMPESPRWLAMKNRDEEAILVVAKLLTDNNDVHDPLVQDEFRDIKDGINTELKAGSASWSELRKPGIFNRVMLGFFLQMFQQWTGINMILYYQTTLIERMNFSKTAATIPFTIANNFVNFIGTFPGLFLIERWGRKKLLVLGGFGMACSHALICLAVTLANGGKGIFWSYMAIFSMYTFYLFFASTWGPVVWVYQAEIFPLRVRSKASSVATMSNWGWNAIIAKVSPLLLSLLQGYMYLIFGAFCAAMATYCIFFMPETKGVSIEDMDILFGSKALLSENKKEDGSGYRIIKE